MVKCHKTPPRPQGPPPTTTPLTDPTGTPFPFLALPRELRDLVYTYTFPVDAVLHYRDPSSASPSPSSSSSSSSPSLLDAPQQPPSPAFLPLLLTARPLHAQVLPQLLRTTTLRFCVCTPGGSRSRSYYSWSRPPPLDMLALDYSLRSFPRGAAALVRRVEIAYDADADACIWEQQQEEEGKDDVRERDRVVLEAWARVVRDAWSMDAHFPGLVRCTARYRGLEEGLRAVFGWEEEKKGWEAWEKGEVAERVAEWVKSGLGPREVVPPEWLRVGFSHGEDAFCGVLEEVMVLAHRLLVVAGRGSEGAEGSGGMWLEGLDGMRKRGRKGWGRGV